MMIHVHSFIFLITNNLGLQKDSPIDFTRDNSLKIQKKIYAFFTINLNLSTGAIISGSLVLQIIQ